MSDLVGREVWVVECGIYEQQYIAGVYATAEAAMTAYPPEPVPASFVPSAHNLSTPGGWRPSQARGWYMSEYVDPEGDYDPDGWYEDPNEWTNGLDWDEAACCRRMVIEGPPDAGAPE